MSTASLIKVPPIIPSGLISMWHGLLASIPPAWILCVHGDTEVTLADGSLMRIQEIVENQVQADVLTYNQNTDQIVTSRIIGWSKVPAERSEWMRISVTKGKGSGLRSLTLTRNHPVLTPKGYVQTKDLTQGSKVYRYENTLSLIGRQAVLGMYLGDGTLCRSGGRFGVLHGEPQYDYIQFIAEKFDVPLYSLRSKSGWGQGKMSHRTRMSLKTLCPEIVGLCGGSEKATPKVLNELGDIGLAFWYMDDGSLSRDGRYPDYFRANLHTEGFGEGELTNIQNYFAGLGIKVKLYPRNNTKGKTLCINRENNGQFFGRIARYIHPSLQYKLPPQYRGDFALAKVPFIEKGKVEFNTKVRELASYNPSKKYGVGYNFKYDILVENTHSFIANGFLIHNCDGLNGTPNLLSRFVQGVPDATTNPGAVGGSTSKTTGGHAHANVATSSAAAHTHTNPETTTVDAHTHTNPTTAGAAAHAHTNPDTATVAGHIHSNPDTGAVAAHAHTNPVTATVVDHTHSNPTTATEATHTHPNPDTATVAAHAHTNPATATVVAHTHTNPTTVAAAAHSHTNPTTGTVADHDHTNPTTAAAAAHSHTNPTTATIAAHAHTSPAHAHGLPTASWGFEMGPDITIFLTAHATGTTTATIDTAGAHSHTQGATGTVGAHGHTQAATDATGAHAHIQGATGTVGAHAHTQGGTGADGVHSHTQAATGTAGVHSHTQGVTGTGAAHAHTQVATGSAGAHSHTQAATGTAAAHSHTQATTEIAGAHSHTQEATGAVVAHAHTQVATGSAGAHSHTQGSTGAVAAHTHTQASTHSATDSIADIRPLFYQIAYIMKT